jgi:hypothetical protein
MTDRWAFDDLLQFVFHFLAVRFVKMGSGASECFLEHVCKQCCLLFIALRTRTVWLGEFAAVVLVFRSVAHLVDFAPEGSC